MSLKRYTRYKDSGVAWLGEVPEHWDVARLKFLSQLVTQKAAERTYALALENIESWTGCYIKTETDFAGEGVSFSAGDLLFGKLRPYLAKVLLADRSGEAVGDFHVLRPQSKTFPRFLQYQLLTKDIIGLIDGSTYGAKMPRADWGYMSNLFLASPPLDEQTAIAAFLDRETAKIDDLIAEQEKLIALLAEKRQATISHAVTKGLSPEVPMKDSGVEWLGEIPAHWSVSAVGYRYEVQLGRMLNEERANGNFLRPYLRVFDVQWGTINTVDLPMMDFPPESQERYILRSGDLLVNEGGSYVGRSAVWRGELEECYYQKALHRLRPYEPTNDTTDFMFYLMEFATRYGVFIAGGNQTTIDHLTAEQFRRYRFGFPSLAEQHLISKHLNNEMAKLASLSDEANRVIDLLKERRMALISAAVTGKIDVRDLSAEIISFPIDKRRMRGLLGVKIVSAFKGNCGRTTVQKVAYLGEVAVGISELEGHYFREAHGPLDRDMIRDIETQAQVLAGVITEQPNVGDAVTYRLSKHPDVALVELDQALGAERSEKLTALVNTLKGLRTHEIEGVATLYAVWNDFLIERKSPSDDDIVTAVLNDWHPKKAEEFSARELHLRLGWMRRHGLVPAGRGPKTDTGRLFV